ncbi:hypothetical protein AB0G03_04575 [Micromonospora aurantiaca]|uniref:hypothetical protein n=1 Tax=Micromonospora aurantiaca (nom. illeg.) TaxID=47850 RepID=UPI0033D6122C
MPIAFFVAGRPHAREDDITDWLRRRLIDQLCRDRVILAREPQVDRIAVKGSGTRIDLTAGTPTQHPSESPMRSSRRSWSPTTSAQRAARGCGGGAAVRRERLRARRQLAKAPVMTRRGGRRCPVDAERVHVEAMSDLIKIDDP